MRPATFRTDAGTRAVRVDEDRAVEIAGSPAVGAERRSVAIYWPSATMFPLASGT